MPPVSEARQRILETAGSLFSERGYELVGINELIKKSDVAKATFYQHFPSKETLCVEWLKHVAAQSAADAQDLLKSPLAAEKKIANRFDDIGGFLKASSFRGCPFSNTAAVMLKTNAVRAVVDQYKAACRQFWQALALQISSDPDKARALGDALFLLLSGAVTEAQNCKALWPVQSAKSAALALCAQHR